MNNSAQGLSPKSNPKEPVLKDIERQTYDMSSYSFMTGAIGSLQTLKCIPVVAGDTWNIDLRGVARLSPLRRPLYMDVKVDLFGFYLPHKNIYTNWQDFVKAGPDEALTLGTDTMTGFSYCTGYPTYAAQAVPRWNVRGYMQIWNRYFRDPTNTTALTETYLSGLALNDPQLKYGLPCGFLKRNWNSTITPGVTSADYSLPLSGGEVNLYELDALKGRLRTETARDWFAIDRYADIMNYSWNTTVSTDSDPRPELIMKRSSWLSSMDVNGQDDATLGSTVSKSVGLVNMHIPPYFCREHGTIWIMALVRFPAVLQYESHYLMKKAEPTYSEITADPEMWRVTKPYIANANEYVASSGSVALGTTPYGQWYRELPHNVHIDYLTSAGHPFLDNTVVLASLAGTSGVNSTYYDSVFQSLQMKHWQTQCNIAASCKTFVPPAESSIFAGSR